MVVTVVSFIFFNPSGVWWRTSSRMSWDSRTSMTFTSIDKKSLLRNGVRERANSSTSSFSFRRRFDPDPGVNVLSDSSSSCWRLRPDSVRLELLLSDVRSGTRDGDSARGLRKRFSSSAEALSESSSEPRPLSEDPLPEGALPFLLAAPARARPAPVPFFSAVTKPWC
jgi:hypothetical protein